MIHIPQHCLRLELVSYAQILTNLVPRPLPSFPSQLSGRGPGTFSPINDITDRANYVNVGIM